MEDSRQVFLRLCKDNHVEPQECVVNQLKRQEFSDKGKATLDLSTNSLSAKTCAVLGKVLATDRTYVEVKFADCMLSDDAIKGLSHGFAANVYCKKLDLKGNNIRGSGAEALGKLLKHNRYLLSLCLEWNALGMLDNAFAAFCEGVAANHTLQALDLRNNQISHDAAAELSVALKRNSTLRAVDLRWNNVGLLGGRAILEMLQTNKGIYRLELAGNNIPGDILKAIETALGQNEDRAMMSVEHQKKTQALSKQIKQVEHDKGIQMGELMGTIDKQEEILRKTKRSSAHKMGHLQDTLEERKSAFNSLAAKLAMTESELALAEQKVNDYNTLLNRVKQEISHQTEMHHNDLRKEKEDRASVEIKLLKELSEANDKNIQLETKVEDLDRKCKQQQDQIFELKEQISQLQAELKMKGSHFDERLHQEKTRHKDSIRDTEQIKQKELDMLKHEHDETERALRDRIQRSELTRLELEEEISRLKTASVTDKMHLDEQLNLAKQKIKSEEENRQKQLEEKIRVLQMSKEEVQQRCNLQNSQISELQAKNSTMTLETETLKRRVDETNLELAEKSSITFSEVGKVKIELNATLQKLEAEQNIHRELRERLSDTDRKMSEQLLKHRETVEEKDRELVSVQEKLRARELEITRIREEESHRAQILQSAVMSYVGRVPQSPGK